VAQPCRARRAERALSPPSRVEHFILIHAHGPQRAGLLPVLLLRRVGVGDQ